MNVREAARAARVSIAHMNRVARAHNSTPKGKWVRHEKTTIYVATNPA
jgi:hypothetical protein